MILKYLFEQPDLNAKKARWLDFLSEYHFELKHIKGKENKIVDALSRWVHMLYEVTLSQIDSDLHERIEMENGVDHFYVEILKTVQEDRLFQQQKEYKVDETILLWSKEILYVPEGGDIKSSILTEFNQKPCSGNPRYQKMISTVNKHFFCTKLNTYRALFIAKYQEFQLVKAEHQHPSRLLQPLPILEWKWEVISMDFITGLPKRKKKNDSIFVVVENLS